MNRNSDALILPSARARLVTAPPPSSIGPTHRSARRQSSDSVSVNSLPSSVQRRIERILHLVSAVRKIDNDAVDLRKERRSAIRARERAKREEGPLADAKACTACRKAKTKCFNVDGAPCTRCQTGGKPCVYPDLRARGRRADRTIQELLNQIDDELTSVLLTDPVPKPTSSTRPNSATRAEADDQAAHSALHNPLGVLATAAEHSGDIGPVHSSSGLYLNNIWSGKAENDFSQDPILQGLLTEEDLNRLVALYFTKLRPLFLHLDPNVHTPNFLRFNSPFLTTAIAAVSASYDPESFLLAPRLEEHAHRLASRAFAQGDKSVEVVQAFLVMVHWASCPSDDWLGDRSWMYQGQAMRLACEIRLDLPPDRELLNMYRHTRALTEDEMSRLASCRQRTYLLVCLSEIALATNSGRADTTSGHRLIRPPDLSFVVPIDETDETFTASVRLNHIFGKALHQWHGMDRDTAETGGRERFVRSWRVALDDWKKEWVGKTRLIDVTATNFHIMLILLSLRIPSSHESTQGLLRQICELAIQMLVTILRWRDEVPFDAPGGLAYAHNCLIVHIAYGAVLVHKLSRLLDKPKTAEVDERVMDMASLLDHIAAARPHAKSFAGYYAKQLRSLVQPGRNHPNLQPPQVVASSAFDPQVISNDAFDFSFLPINYEFSLDASISDPILSFLAAPNISADGTWQ